MVETTCNGTVLPKYLRPAALILKLTLTALLLLTVLSLKFGLMGSDGYRNFEAYQKDKQTIERDLTGSQWECTQSPELTLKSTGFVGSMVSLLICTLSSLFQIPISFCRTLRSFFVYGDTFLCFLGLAAAIVAYFSLMRALGSSRTRRRV